MPIHLVQGDITQRGDDAIVNAANEMLLAGGGVCGAIHRAAGPELEQECRAIGRCPTGSAVITKGYALKARHVIHAVGPRWQGGTRGEAELLKSCYANIFYIIKERGLRSIALPAISTGIFGYPLEEATEIAICEAQAFCAFVPQVDVTFVCFDTQAYAIYKKRLA
jgi:O-acetyl-ADP-ribose deacetylase (regulator of RNase III)